MKLPLLFRAPFRSSTSQEDMAVTSRSTPNSPQDSLISPLARNFSRLQKRLPDVPKHPLPSIPGKSHSFVIAHHDEPPLPPQHRQLVRQESHEVDTCHDNAPSPAPLRPSLIHRPHRPAALTLKRSRGFTDVPLVELRRRIVDESRGALDIAEQFARPKLRKIKRRATPQHHTAMGNHQSTHAHLTDDDAHHGPIRVLRKSSTLLFNKRGDSQTPLPRPATATTIVADPGPDSSLYGERRGGSGYVEDYQLPAHRAKTPSIAVHSSRSRLSSRNYRHGEPRPSSATTVIRDLRVEDPSDPEETSDESEYEPRSAALSPTIPDITSLPEDSPHKYGLLDRMDTPVPEPPTSSHEAILQTKASRRFSGVELFREATSLASASSFLNGLSVSRRRAQSTGSWTRVSSRSRSRSRVEDASRPKSALPAIYNEHDERRHGHNFKTSGFAYSRPLALSQIRCYRNHARLLANSNKCAPVECAICHMDDDQDHYTCSWCALRMCRYCQQDLLKRGLAALKERVKMAETGDHLPQALKLQEDRHSKWTDV